MSAQESQYAPKHRRLRGQGDAAAEDGVVVCVLHVPQAGGWKARKIVNPGSAEWPEVVDERE
jgi:hypothetical protein